MTSMIYAGSGATLVVHMGLPKTGTTFLQDQVFRTCSQVADFGKDSYCGKERPQIREALGMISRLPDAAFKAPASNVKTVLIRAAEQAASQHPALAA